MKIVYSYLWIIVLHFARICKFVLPFKDHASFCYACISNYTTYSWVNLTEQITVLLQKGINVPETASEKCNERLAIDEMPEYKYIPGVFCASGVCAKLKWTVMHSNKKLKETFVIRHCWDKMWSASYEDAKKWFNCSNVEDMSEFEANMCTCHKDLCNNSWQMSRPFLSKINAIFVIVLGVLKI